jgi:hypothetical protein
VLAFVTALNLDALFAQGSSKIAREITLGRHPPKGPNHVLQQARERAHGAAGAAQSAQARLADWLRALCAIALIGAALFGLNWLVANAPTGGNIVVVAWLALVGIADMLQTAWANPTPILLFLILLVLIGIARKL